MAGLTSILKERFKVPKGVGDLERECLCPLPWCLWEWGTVVPGRTKVEAMAPERQPIQHPDAWRRLVFASPGC